MRIPLLIAWIALSSPLAAQVDPLQEELHKLAGQWVQSSVEADGHREEMRADAPAVTISGTMWIDKSPAGAHASTFTIDPAKEPKQIDKVLRLRNGKTMNIPGIYMVGADTLTVCEPFPFNGNFSLMKKRADGFATKRGDPFVVTTFKRRK